MIACPACEGRGEVPGDPEHPDYNEDTGTVPCTRCEGTGGLEPEERKTPTFRVVTQVYRVPVGSETQELVSSVGHTVQSPTFVEAFPAISEVIQSQLAKVAEYAHLVDEG